MVFTVGVILLGAVSLLGVVFMLMGCMALGQWLVVAGLSPLVLYSLALLVDAFCFYRSLHIAFLSVAAAFTQLWGTVLASFKHGGDAVLRAKTSLAHSRKHFYK